MSDPRGTARLTLNDNRGLAVTDLQWLAAQFGGDEEYAAELMAEAERQDAEMQESGSDRCPARE